MGKGHAVAAARPFLGARSDGAMNPCPAATRWNGRDGCCIPVTADTVGDCAAHQSHGRDGSTKKRTPTAPVRHAVRVHMGWSLRLALLFTRGCATTEDHATRV
jgi:hypothetical protein